MTSAKKHSCCLKPISLVAILFFILIIRIQAQEQQRTFPGKDWLLHDSVQLLGYDSKKIDNIVGYIIDSMNTTGLLVAVDGKILFDFGDTQELSYLASCRKSVLSMMYGKYVDNGTINLDMTLEELKIDDIHGLLPAEKQATIRDLITARSGIYHPSSNGGNELQSAPGRGTVKPGSFCFYNNWDFNAAGAIFEKLTHKSIYEAFEQDIAVPVGMQDYKISEQKKIGDTTKSDFLAYHFLFSTRDMARLGLLMLNYGNWNGKQVVPAGWIKLTTFAVTPPEGINPKDLRDGDFGYGYMWWIWCSENEILKGSYWARGSFGQFLVVIPKLNMVISHKTKPDYGRGTSFTQFKKMVTMIIESKSVNSLK